MPKIKKSINFEANKDKRRIMSQIEKNIYVLGSATSTLAKQKYVPIATRQIFSSVKLFKKKKSFVLTSIDYPNVSGSGVSRYHYKKPNKTYKIKGVTIPAGKNNGKYEWFSRAGKELKSSGKEKQLLNREVIK